MRNSFTLFVFFGFFNPSCVYVAEMSEDVWGIVGIGFDKRGRNIGGAQENSGEIARCRADREN